MDLNLNQNYKKVLDKEFKKFKSFLLDTDESFYSYEKKDLECLFLSHNIDFVVIWCDRNIIVSIGCQ